MVSQSVFVVSLVFKFLSRHPAFWAKGSRAWKAVSIGRNLMLCVRKQKKIMF